MFREGFKKANEDGGEICKNYWERKKKDTENIGLRRTQEGATNRKFVIDAMESKSENTTKHKQFCTLWPNSRKFA